MKGAAARVEQQARRGIEHAVVGAEKPGRKGDVLSPSLSSTKPDALARWVKRCWS
jgi:hypothetical protein